MSRYDVKSIANSCLPVGGFSSKAKNSSDSSASNTKSNDGSQSAADRESSAATFTSQPSSSSFAIPTMKQDPTIDYWSNILGYHHQNPASHLRNPSNNNVTIASHLQSFNNNNNNTTEPFSLELQRNNNNTAFIYGGVIVQNIHEQQQSGSNDNKVESSSSSGIPMATAIGINNSNGSYESDSGYGNWSIGSGLHTFQTHAKGSLFQTPIFGME